MHLEKNNKMDCFDNNVLVPLSKLEGFNYNIYFLKMYNIIYKEEERLLLNHNLDYGHPYRINGLDALKDIYNIDYSILNAEDFASRDQIIPYITKAMKEGKQVAVTLDSYGCKWSHFYLDQHMLHTILLLDYDEKTATFKSSDIYLNEDDIEITAENLLEYFSWLICFTTDKKTLELSKEAVSESFKNYILNLSDKDIIEPLEAIYSSLKGYKYSAEDKEYYASPDKSYFIIRFIALSWSRYNFAEAMSFIDTLYTEPVFTNVIQRLTQLASDWEKFKNLLVFLMTRAVPENEYVFNGKIISKMETLITEEKSISENLFEICKSL